MDVLQNIGRHLLFVIGRGRSPINGGFNFPENPKLKDMNVVYVDANNNSRPDINRHIQNVNFDVFFPTLHNTKIIFMFDWSSFYCNAMDALKCISKRIKQRFAVLVPLGINEYDVPSEITQTLTDTMFEICIVHGKYPLFNWNKNADSSNDIYDIVNESTFLIINIDTNNCANY